MVVDSVGTHEIFVVVDFVVFSFWLGDVCGAYLPFLIYALYLPRYIYQPRKGNEYINLEREMKKEDCVLTDEEFMKLADKFHQYKAKEKVFTINRSRIEDIELAREIAKKLFPDSKIYLADDPLGMGAIILRIEDFYLPVREIKLFQKMINTADNFDISIIGEEEVRLALLFNKAAIRIG